MRHRSTIVWLLSVLVSASAAAQTVRGTVVDETSKLPIASALISLIDETGAEVPPGVRSDSMGNFMIHAQRLGTWRVRGARIGYSPVTSEPISLAIGQLAVVRLRMTTLAQQLVPVQVVEKRALSANELMSTMGFDSRERRGQGRFLSGGRLAEMGLDGVGEVLGTQFQPVLFVYNDPVLGDVLRLRQGARQCEPEVYLDGRLLATTPEPAALVDGPEPATLIDSMRAQGRADSDQSRRGYGQVAAMSILSALTATALHGIEVYRANEVPPPGLGGWFGMTKASVGGCGTVAVWTKAGARSVVTTRSNTMPGRPLQVISGTLVDFDTGAPLPGRSVSLLTEGKDPVGSPVQTDTAGAFTIRTARAGELRLMGGGNDYVVSMTPVFSISTNELMVVKLFVSTRGGVLAPLGVAGRVLPQNVGLTSLSGFTYRRERAQGGAFFRKADIAGSSSQSFADLVRDVSGIAVADAPARGTIEMTRPGLGNCRPAYYVDGKLGEAGQAAIAAIPLSRIFGVEVYTHESEVPSVFSDMHRCGVIVIWTDR